MNSNFEQLGLSSKTLKAVDELGFATPTPIQEKVIPYILQNSGDIVGLAQTGTGKTAAFGLPILEKTDLNERNVQTLVLCPTRELCLQITHDMESYSRYIPSLSITPVYGGAGMSEQIRAVRQGTHVIVATPGRLLDLINRKVANIGNIQHLVLDEADIMMNMGFKEELDAILETAPHDRQTLLFSATMPKEVAHIALNYMKDPVELSVGRKNSAAESVEHQYFMVPAKDKYSALKRIVDYYPDVYGIIFCRTRVSTQEIADNLIKDGYSAESLHGDLSQVQREYVMRKFRDKHIRLLVATDIAARGLDVNNLTHVINYDLPDETDAYTHRSGRTGRAGKTGLSLTIINMKERYKIERIEKSVKVKIVSTPVPLGRQICEKQLIHLTDRLTSVKLEDDKLSPYMPAVMEKLADVSKEDLVRHFISLEFSRFLNYYHNLPDLAPMIREKEKTVVKKSRSKESLPLRRERSRYEDEPSDRKSRGKNGKNGFTSVMINFGRQDQILPPQLIGLINQTTKNRHIRLGRIDIDKNFSKIQVESRYVDDVFNALKGSKFRGRKIQIENA